MANFLNILCVFLVTITQINCDLTLPDINAFFESNPLINHSANLTSVCGQFYSSPDDLMQRLILYDASGTIPTGVLSTNFYDLGNFNECLNTKGQTTSGYNYHGKYCLGSFANLSPFNEVEKTLGNSLIGFGLQVGQCMPDFCFVEDFTSRFSGGRFHENYCYTKANLPELTSKDAGAVFTLTLIAFIGFLLVVSTIYDVFLHYNKTKSRHPLLVAFSGWTNSRKIFISTTDPNQLLCLNGIKAISMIWIILFHEYQNGMLNAFTNLIELEDHFTNKKNMYIIQGTVAVDSFFAAGGLVLVYTFMRSRDKGVKYNVIMSYVHRYFRLTPVLAVMILIHLFILNYISKGPFWSTVDSMLVNNCREYWWSALLYVQNLVNPINNCVNQSWYLSADMQLFFVAPIILIPLRKRPKIAIYMMYVLILAGVVVPMTISFVNQYEVSGTAVMVNGDQYMKDLYFRSYTRFGPYVVGMLTGYHVYLLKVGKTKVQLKMWQVLVAWTIILTTLWAVLYGAADLMGTGVTNVWINSSIYNGTFRTAWAIALCGMSYLCIAGCGGPINGFLSAPLFQILGKLSYSMYIVHYSITILRVSSSKVSSDFNDFTNMFNFWGDFMITLGISFFFSLMFELPFITVEKYFIMMVMYPIKSVLRTFKS